MHLGDGSQGYLLFSPCYFYTAEMKLVIFMVGAENLLNNLGKFHKETSNY